MENLKFPKLKNHSLAEFIGIILGDGSLGIYKCKSNGKIKIQYKLQITCHSIDDLEYLNYVKSLFKKLFGVNFHQSFRKNEKACDLRIFRKEIIEFFINYLNMNLAPKWNRAKIPKIFMNKDFKKDLLRGYFDTDGSVVITNNNGTIYPRLEFKISPSPMQNQFIQILGDLGFNFGVYRIGKGKVRIQMNGKKELLKWIQNIGFRNPKHINKIKRVAGTGFEPATFTPGFPVGVS